MPKRWVSRTFRTCVPGIQAAGFRRWPVVCAISGPIPCGRGCRCAVDAGHRLVDGAWRLEHSIRCPCLPRWQTEGSGRGQAHFALTSEGFWKGMSHADPRGPGKPAIDIEVSMEFDDRRKAGRIQGPAGAERFID